MKIIALEAENVKRLKAVRIKPDGTLQVIGGRNAQGKSAVLDAIWLALGGGPASKANPKPVRDGETEASVSIDLGELKVTRTWSNGNTALQVLSKDGARYGKAQSTLDALVGAVGFDPWEFTRQDARKQRDTLLGLVDLDVDLDALAAERQRIYDERTEIGRQGKALGDVPDVPKDAPTQEVSASDLLDRISEAESHNRSVDAQLRDCADARRALEQAKIDLADAQRRVKDLTDLVAGNDKWEASDEAKRIDTDAMRAELDGIEESNRQARANAEALRKIAEHERLTAEYKKASEQIAAIDEKRAKALASAKFPIDGLGFDDAGVTYRGVPFSQASTAEQIRVSLAIGMALNPKLRVLMIRDGSLLDDESMAAIREQVAEKDFQLFVERVGDGDEGAVIISDGEVAA